MAAELLQAVKVFLDELENTQREMQSMFRDKRAAMTQASAEQLLGIADIETQLVNRMRGHLAQRGRILQQAETSGLPHASIFDLTTAIGKDEQADLQIRIGQARLRADELRQETWIHWIIAQRAGTHFAQMLELIAHAGQEAPTYSEQPHDDAASATFLDASI